MPEIQYSIVLLGVFFLRLLFNDLGLWEDRGHRHVVQESGVLKDRSRAFECAALNLHFESVDENLVTGFAINAGFLQLRTHRRSLLVGIPGFWVVQALEAYWTESEGSGRLGL